MNKKTINYMFGTILFFSILTFIGSFELSVASVQLAANPEQNLSCDFSETVSCTKVALSWQAQVFGFPNAFLGLMFEPVLIFLSVIYLSGGKVKNWILSGIQVLSIISLIFALWLFVQSAFYIQVLCPWCLAVLTATVITDLLFIRFNSLNKTFGTKISGGLTKLSAVYLE